MRQKTKKHSGFTIIELLIATVVFSLVLLVFLAALIRISQIFYKGINMSNTQEAARNVLQDISDDIQFYSGSLDFSNLNQGYFCIGDHRYAFSKGVQVGSGNPNDYGIVREIMPTCKPLTGPGSQSVDLSKAEKMLDPGMQLNDLQISQLNGGWSVSVFVVYYGSDNTVFHTEDPNYVNNPNDPSFSTNGAFKAPDAQCTGQPSSSQFCATVKYESTILQKI